MCDIRYACFEICPQWDRRAGRVARFSDDCTGCTVDCCWDDDGLGEAMATSSRKSHTPCLDGRLRRSLFRHGEVEYQLMIRHGKHSSLLP